MLRNPVICLRGRKPFARCTPFTFNISARRASRIGCSLVCPWVAHRQPMGNSWNFITAHGAPTVYHWAAHENTIFPSLGDPWAPHGLPMTGSRSSVGISKSMGCHGQLHKPFIERRHFTAPTIDVSWACTIYIYPLRATPQNVHDGHSSNAHHGEARGMPAKECPSWVENPRNHAHGMPGMDTPEMPIMGNPTKFEVGRAIFVTGVINGRT